MMKRVIRRISLELYWSFRFFKNGFSKKFILVNTPNHGNLGDQAITKAELKFIKDNFNECCIDITGFQLDNYFHIIRKYIRKKDIIFIHGGGYLGTLWLHEENRCRRIITEFLNNSIIIFPQTIYFSNDEKGKKELQISKEIYSKHKNLTLMLRDNKSYQFCLEQFSNTKCKYFPDMVMYLDYSHLKDIQRNDILFCFRNDIEKNIDDNLCNLIISYVENNHFHYSFTDTVINSIVSIENRDIELEKKFNEFRSSKLVITDRLHGMIFSAITGTPCIAFDNISHKVSGVYDWIKGLDYIKVVNNIDEFYKEFDNMKLKLNDIYYYDNYNDKQFNDLYLFIKQVLLIN